MPPDAHPEADLPRRAPNERSTRQKRALADALDASQSFRSAQELHAELRTRGANIGLTTVYNQLRALVENGELDALRGDDGETLYRRCSTDDHHHHLTCRQCGRAVEVEGPEIEQWATTVAAKYGFVDIDHTVEVIGLCGDCSPRGRREA